MTVRHTIAFRAVAPMLEASFDSSPIQVPALIETPCEKICVLDPVSGLCSGCGRSLSEIERWTAYSDGERSRIMAELPGRLDAMQARPGAATHT
jgi:predicted Fe-S protein YdhL (DUF1289 family)